MTFEKYGICLLGLALLAGCKGCCEKPPPTQYSVTLYGNDGAPIRNWVCDDYQFSRQCLIPIKDRKVLANIHGTYIIERIDQ